MQAKYLYASLSEKDKRIVTVGMPLRTAGMSYLIYRELMYPLDKWTYEIVKTRNKFARRHSLKQRDFNLKWKDYSK